MIGEHYSYYYWFIVAIAFVASASHTPVTMEPESSLIPPFADVDFLDVTKLPLLLDNLLKQLKTGSYDRRANQALLKIFQFHPDKLDPDVVARVLIKALMQLPDSDFLMCLYLVPQLSVRLSRTGYLQNLTTASLSLCVGVHGSP